jgi:hypothetical protein
LECRLLLLYWMWRSENLDDLNGGGWAVFIAPTTILAVVVDGTTDSPVVHWTWHCSISDACHVSRPLGFGAVVHWSPLSSCGTGQYGGTPYSPMCSDFAVLTSDLRIVHYLSNIAVDRWAAVDRCSVGSPDMSGAHQTVRWIIAERLSEKPESGQFVGALAWAPDSVRCATGNTMLVFAPNL